MREHCDCLFNFFERHAGRKPNGKCCTTRKDPSIDLECVSSLNGIRVNGLVDRLGYAAAESCHLNETQPYCLGGMFQLVISFQAYVITAIEHDLSIGPDVLRKYFGRSGRTTDLAEETSDR